MSILLKIRFFYYWYVYPLVKLFREDKNTYKVSLLNRVKLLLKGFKSDKYFLYKLSENNISKYISDYHRNRFYFINKKFSQLFNNKVIFSKFMSEYVDTPKVYSLLHNSKFTKIDPEINILSFDDLLEFVKSKTLILKPIGGSGGEGVLKLEYIAGKYFLNNKETDTEQLRKTTSNLFNYFISEFLEQGEYIRSVFPHTANTIRMITYIEPTHNDASILVTAQRVGSSKSIPVDNVSGGGIYILVDSVSGELKYGVRLNEDYVLENIDTHFETNVKFSGIIIPNWDVYKNIILRTHNNLSSFFPLIGWDILITDNQMYVLECNIMPDFKFQQLFPISEDKNFVGFLKFHKVI